MIIIKASPKITVKAYQANALNKSTLGDSAIKVPTMQKHHMVLPT